MSDPLGFINRAGGSGGAYAPGGGVQPPAGGRAVDPTKPSFKDMLLENIKDADNAQKDASAAIEDVVSGKRNDLEGVLLATQKADAAFRMLIASRNKVMQAYEEIKQLRV
jgi:flagellar hook-basal body complex protein FliE